jgi:hypothetical protein
MFVRKLVVLGGICVALGVGQSAVAQDENMTCADIEWSSTVTNEFPTIESACDAVTVKNGKLFARVEVEVLRVRGRTLTFRFLNNDGTFGGTYTQTVDTAWRAKIGGREYRPRDLSRGQQLNVYMPHDRWAIIHEDDDGPDDMDAVVITAAPMLPETASPLFLFGLGGAGFLALASGLGLVRRRRS